MVVVPEAATKATFLGETGAVFEALGGVSSCLALDVQQILVSPNVFGLGLAPSLRKGKDPVRESHKFVHAVTAMAILRPVKAT